MTGAGLVVELLDVELDDGQHTRMPLKDCTWLVVSLNGGQTWVPPSSLIGTRLDTIRLTLAPRIKPAGSQWKLRIWGRDLAFNGFSDQTNDDLLADRPVIRMVQQETSQ